MFITYTIAFWAGFVVCYLLFKPMSRKQSNQTDNENARKEEHTDTDGKEDNGKSKRNE